MKRENIFIKVREYIIDDWCGGDPLLDPINKRIEGILDQYAKLVTRERYINLEHFYSAIECKIYNKVNNSVEIAYQMEFLSPVEPTSKMCIYVTKDSLDCLIDTNSAIE